MPGNEERMDGLFLAIFLTGFAIAAGTCLFLAVRLRSLRILLQEQEQIRQRQDVILNINRQVIKEKLILRLCYGGHQEEKEMEAVILYYGFQAFLERAMVVLLHYTTAGPLSADFHKDSYYLAQKNLIQTCTQAAAPYFESFWLWENPATMIGILANVEDLSEESRLESIHKLGGALQEVCCSDSGNAPVIAFGSGHQKLSDSYREASELLSHKIHTHAIHPYSYEEFKRIELQFSYNKQSLLCRYVLLGKTNDAVELLSSYFSVIHANPDTSLGFAKETSFQILHTLRNALEKQPALPAADALLEDVGSRISQFSTVHQIGAYMVETVRKLCESSIDARFSKGKKKVDSLIQWLEENYSRDISLEDMAAHIACSVSYTSRLFKKEAGCDVSTYLSRIRISHAKELLTKTQMNLAEIAAAVGFNNQQTLIRNFKNLTGLTPTEFRHNP